MGRVRSSLRSSGVTARQTSGMRYCTDRAPTLTGQLTLPTVRYAEAAASHASELGYPACTNTVLPG